MAVYTTIKTGSSGEDVRRLQNLLNQNGASLTVDGVFGDSTRSAVQDYQAKNNITANGVVGGNTWNALTGSSDNQRPGHSGMQDNTPTATDWSGLAGVSAQTQAKLDQYEAGYTPSQSVQNAMAYLEQVKGNKPGAFSSTYEQTLNDLYAQIAGRKPFEYDLGSDMLYQQYRDQYMRMGQLAMEDTLGQAAALTGGYANSYAQGVGQQQYNAYLQALNERVPDLYNAALNRYGAEGDALENQYALAADRYNTEYGQYRDQVADWQNDFNAAQNVYDNERTFDYGQHADMLNYWASKAQVENQDFRAHGNGIVSGSGGGYSSSVKTGNGSGGGSGGSSSGAEKDDFESFMEAINGTTIPSYRNGLAEETLIDMPKKGEKDFALTEAAYKAQKNDNISDVAAKAAGQAMNRYAKNDQGVVGELMPVTYMGPNGQLVTEYIYV